MNCEGIQGLEALWQASSVLREAASRYYRDNTPHTTKYLRMCALQSASSSNYVPLAAFEILCQHGHRPLEVYASLVQVFSSHKGATQLENQYARVRVALRRPESI